MTPTVRRLHPTYLRLVRSFPLRSIRTDVDLAAAQTVLDALLQGELDEGGNEYLDALTDLVECYEKAAHPIPDAPAGDVLELLLTSNGLSQSQLAREVGISQSTLSALVAGTRAPTAEHAVALGKRFGVSPVAFLPRA